MDERLSSPVAFASHRTRLVIRVASVICVALCLACCSGRGPLDDPWARPDEACERHAQCNTDEACIDRACVPGGLELRLALGHVDASPWFAAADGTCRWDTDCGPWACVDERCAPPESAARYASVRLGDVSWVDGSCRTAADCGGLLCAADFCTAVGHAAPDAAPGYEPVSATDRACVADEMCPDGQDCVAPGRCAEGVAELPMSYLDIDAAEYLEYDDGTCNFDADCGPWVCHDGWCMRPEYAGRPTPQRGDLRWYDGSCSGDSDCGDYICLRQFCVDPNRFDVFAGDQDGDTDAARAWRAGGVSVPVHTPAASDPLLSPIRSPDIPENHTREEPLDGIDAALDAEAGALIEAILIHAASDDDAGTGVFGDDDMGFDDLEPVLESEAILGAGRGGGSLSVDSPARTCLEHDDCRLGEACVAPGRCEAGRLDEPMTVDEMDPSRWFDNADGACARHGACGSWACNEGQCAPWTDMDIAMPPRRAFRFYDLSCSANTDCGEWVCDQGFCAPP